MKLICLQKLFPSRWHCLLVLFLKLKLRERVSMTTGACVDFTQARTRLRQFHVVGIPAYFTVEKRDPHLVSTALYAWFPDPCLKNNL